MNPFYFEPVETRLAFMQCLDCLEIIETSKSMDDLPDLDRCPECGGFDFEIGLDYFQE
jgi:Zn finger protein HypA/HybF involved in hydrogenase expression